jgi:hypothetical protein
MYKYWGYGLHILSEIEFPELLPFDFDKADLTITTGITPKQLTGEGLVQKVRVAMTPTAYLQQIAGVANYFAENGNSIIIEPQLGADDKSIRLFLLSSAMAAILHQRNLIPLHASAIYHNDGIVLFCGQSGVGKSTIVTSLQAKGYKVFSDDVCVLKEVDGFATALPSYPMIKLWADSFEKTGLEMAGEDKRVRPEIPKYARFFHEEFDVIPKPIKQIFKLETSNVIVNVEVEKLGYVESFKLLQSNSYRPMQMNAMQKRGFHFSTISKLAAVAPVYKLSRPSYINTIVNVTALIESHLL